jgi:hypothetical protein
LMSFNITFCVFWASASSVFKEVTCSFSFRSLSVYGSVLASYDFAAFSSTSSSPMRLWDFVLISAILLICSISAAFCY